MEANLYSRLIQYEFDENGQPTMRPDYALFDVGAQGAVVSSAMLAKYGIEIPATERKKVRLLGVQGASTIQDKVTIVFEIFGNRVDAKGCEIDLISTRESLLLQVDAIIVDDPNITMLLGMNEAVKAELVFHAQTGRIMRMIQPYGADVHIYHATTIFKSAFLNGSMNDIPQPLQQQWQENTTSCQKEEMRQHAQMLAINHIPLYRFCQNIGEPSEERFRPMGTTTKSSDVFEPWSLAGHVPFPTTTDVMSACTPAVLAYVGKTLAESSPLHLLSPLENTQPTTSVSEPSMVTKLQALREKWREYTTAVAALPLAAPDGTPIIQASLAQARLQWDISDKEGPEMSAETFHFLHTHELLEFPQEQE
jgi:hypothetical protein